MTIAQTILKQLGGGRFAVMTGARAFTSLDNGLMFSLPGGGGFTKGGINRVRIMLNSMDLYDVDYYKLRGTKLTTVATSEGLYADMLTDNFTRITGLEVSLGTCGR